MNFTFKFIIILNFQNSIRLTEDEITKRVGERRQELLDKMKKSFDNRQEFILEFLQSRR